MIPDKSDEYLDTARDALDNREPAMTKRRRALDLLSARLKYARTARAAKAPLANVVVPEGTNKPH